MKILGMGMPELIIILVVVLLIFGPKNLPKLGSALGKTVKGLRDGMSDGKDDNVKEAEEETEEAEDDDAPAGAIEAGEEDAAAPKKRVKKVVKTKA